MLQLIQCSNPQIQLTQSDVQCARSIDYFPDGKSIYLSIQSHQSQGIDSSPSNLSGPHTPCNSLAISSKLTTEQTTWPQPVILLEGLPASMLLFYQKIDLHTIDTLAKGSQHLTAATEVSNVVGKKWPKQQVQCSQINISLSDSGDKASDEADTSSDSTKEPNRKQLSSRCPNKH